MRIKRHPWHQNVAWNRECDIVGIDRDSTLFVEDFRVQGVDFGTRIEPTEDGYDITVYTDESKRITVGSDGGWHSGYFYKVEKCVVL